MSRTYDGFTAANTGIALLRPGDWYGYDRLEPGIFALALGDDPVAVFEGTRQELITLALAMLQVAESI